MAEEIRDTAVEPAVDTLLNDLAVKLSSKYLCLYAWTWAAPSLGQLSFFLHSRRSLERCVTGQRAESDQLGAQP